MNMKRKCILYIAASLDGYIADENGNIDWLYEVKGDGGDNGYSQFESTVDTVIMGKKSYDQILTFGDWPYKGKRCYVFTHTEQGENEYVEFVSGSVKAFMNELTNKEGSNIWILGGAELIDLFIKEKLIDEFIIAVIPMILGKGIALFKDNNPKTALSVKEIKTFGEIVQLHYVTNK